MVNQEVQNKLKKVYVALSGGVDSATAALLLQEKGYAVTGVYMRTWAPEGYPCPWREEKRDAMRICAHLKIPFKVWDFTSDYKAKVVDYMTQEYSRGKTPNPDVMCNKEIKFGLFFKRAMSEGADLIATGHYSRIKKGTGRARLYKAKDTKKDQSYFLWAVNSTELEKTLMPIGEIESKGKVRDIARKYGLPVSEKKDSQGICFIGPIEIRQFLKENINESPGFISTSAGKIIGAHEGLSLYTKGQREGVGVGGSGPYYVSKKDYSTNTLVVSPPSDENEIYSSKFELAKTNLISKDLMNGDKIEVAVRYGQKPVSATYISDRFIKTDEPIRAVTEGQSAALYVGEELVGGGIIESVQ